MKQIARDEFYALFDEIAHAALNECIERFNPIALVLFENHDMCSSHFGARTAMPVGPNNTYKTIEECKGQHIYDLPSQRQYAVSYMTI